MAGWTDEQIDRADSSKFLQFLEEEEWPRAIVEGSAEPDADGEGVEYPDAESLGMHRLHQLYWDLHAPEEDEEDEPVEYGVWRRDNGEWRTDFPPPLDFDPFDEDGEFGDADYSRKLTAAERDAIPDEPLECDLRERERIRAEAERDAWFARSAAGVGAPDGDASIM